jgi:hypothetical protein
MAKRYVWSWTEYKSKSTRAPAVGEADTKVVNKQATVGDPPLSKLVWWGKSDRKAAPASASALEAFCGCASGGQKSNGACRKGPDDRPAFERMAVMAPPGANGQCKANDNRSALRRFLDGATGQGW